MINKFLSFLSFITILSSCTNQVLIDNPKDISIKVTIDKKDYKIDAHSNLELKLKNGFHSVSTFSDNGDSLLIKNIEINKDGLLNVTQATYVLWTDLYCNDEDYESLKSNLSLKDTVRFDGLEFIGIDFEILNTDFIVKTWDFNLDQKMPEIIDLSEGETYKIISKLYTPQEIKDEFNYLGDINFDGLTDVEINKILEERSKK